MNPYCLSVVETILELDFVCDYDEVLATSIVAVCKEFVNDADICLCAGGIVKKIRVPLPGFDFVLVSFSPL